MSQNNKRASPNSNAPSKMDIPKEDPSDLLERTNLAEYLRARKAIAAESSQQGLPTRPVLPTVLRVDETVSSAMTALSTMRVQSAPLVMMHTDNQHYDAQCFLSVGDLVLGLLERVNSDGTAGRELGVLDRMARLTALGQSYGEAVEAISSDVHLRPGDTKLVDIRSRWDGTGVWAAATEDMSLADALRRCMHIGDDTLQEAGSPLLRQCPHRFAVIDTSGLVTDIVAQSDIAMYLRRNIELLDPSVVNATVQSLNLGAQGGRRVVSVTASTPVIDCFYEMERQNVQAVAIIDDGTDAIVGNISETDLMTLKADAYGALALPVGEYLIHAHLIVPKVPPESERGLYSPESTVYSAALAREGAKLTVTVTSEATVAEVLDLMHVKAVHRVWVVDDAKRPTGVIALSDVLAAIATKNPGGGHGASVGTSKSMNVGAGGDTTTTSMGATTSG